MTTPLMTTRKVRLGDLKLEHEHWSNPRSTSGLDDRSIEAFGEELKLRGIQDPPKVQRVMVGDEVIDLVVDGQRRVRSALTVMSKNTEIEVIDRTAEPIELTWEVSDLILLEMLSVASYREGLSSIELSDVAERMRNRGRTLADIAQAVRRDESWVSKILKARLAATPKLYEEWRRGRLSDEQFKDCANVKDPEKQIAVVKEVLDARKSGDLAGGRLIAKEAASSAKPSKPVVPKQVSGRQLSLIKPDRKAPSKSVLEDAIKLAEARAPVHDYPKGVLDGFRVALGVIELDDLPKAWTSYVQRVLTGKGPVKKAGKKSRAKKARK